MRIFGLRITAAPLSALVLMTFLINFFLACAPVMTSGTPAIKNENVMNHIKPGVTNKTDVYQLLGAPMQAHNLASGEVWTYHYSEINRKFHLVGWGGIFDSTLDSQSTMIQITFDDRDLVKAISGRPAGSNSGIVSKSNVQKSQKDVSTPGRNQPSSVAKAGNDTRQQQVWKDPNSSINDMEIIERLSE